MIEAFVAKKFLDGSELTRDDAVLSVKFHIPLKVKEIQVPCIMPTSASSYGV